MKLKFSLLFILLIANIVVFAQDIKILSSSSSSITVEYSPVYTDTTFFIENGESCFSVNILGTYLDNQINPQLGRLPVRELKVGIQSELGNTLQIVSETYSNISGKYLNKNESWNNAGNGENKSSEENYRYGESVVFGQYALIRNLQVQSILIFPVIIDYGNMDEAAE